MRTAIVGTGFHVPDRVVTNDELTRFMDTSDEWIRERTGIRERRWVREGTTGAAMAAAASRMALEEAGLPAGEVDAIVLATLSPDHFFPGTGVFLQRELGLDRIPALDLRAQCSGFLYGLSVADAWIRVGQYRTILLVGVEIQSTGIDLSTGGRDMAVLFGDGAGAAVLQATEDPDRGVLSTHIHAQGEHAEILWCDAAASFRHPRIGPDDLAQGRHYPRMNGREVFKHAVSRMPEAVEEALAANGLGTEDIDLLIPHQANLRISQMVQRRLGLGDDRVFNNIERYGNTTAATIPIALAEAVREQRLSPGDLLCFCAFGSGLTWGSALVRW
ncbi:MAG TPA: beta-ketoacyl-ACP synthase III [Longimicrobiales bacterium]|nr:beta-ketoacyl-ACP synthase III [Longimicrobiales bacterium]